MNFAYASTASAFPHLRATNSKRNKVCLIGVHHRAGTDITSLSPLKSNLGSILILVYTRNHPKFNALEKKTILHIAPSRAALPRIEQNINNDRT